MTVALMRHRKDKSVFDELKISAGMYPENYTMQRG